MRCCRDTRADLPPTPENLHVVNMDRGRVSVAWQPAKETADAPVEGYVIEVAPSNSNDFEEIGRVPGNDMCMFDATGLKEGQKYNFRIRAENQAGVSAGFASLDKPVAASPMGKTHSCVWCSSFSLKTVLLPNCVGSTLLIGIRNC